ncbi:MULTISPECIES: flagellar assembly protein FliW [Thiorhodovibrio]|uniref:flagellar assembly protein FliW n=1 Tax=Thiorhodovibrio TaxID=61593 RepID=UPI00191404F2|nr:MULTISPECIES: flagellar assembly protein FliW [Thiorhodovibrio]MBK5968598.1 flagellar biosynthesis protein FliW [Thiorhodovibrio winogradskyi]WPL11303.1 Flagellar assembly factor FliW [Thiorhodovibrio litoralis]
MAASSDRPQIDANKIITFPQGLPGFEDDHRFTMFHNSDGKPEEQSNKLFWLESLDSPDVRFTVVDPTLYGLNYVIDLNDEEQALLQSKDPNEILVLLMLARNDESDAAKPKVHANIAGPILINTENRLALQKVLTRSRVEVNIVGAAADA